MNRQKQILFGLVIVLLLALLYSWWATPQQETATTGVKSRTTTREPTAPESPSAVDTQRVHLELLEVDKEKYNGYRRNIFVYYKPKPKVKPEPKPQPIPKPVVKEPPKPAVIVTPQVRQQLARFTFLGFLVKEQVRMVFLSTRDELYIAKSGDTFGEKNQFEVLDVTEEQMTIRQAGAEGLIEIKLIEEEPLIPSFSPGEVSRGNDTMQGDSQPVGNPLPQKGVPPSERRRQWFKGTQPESNEPLN